MVTIFASLLLALAFTSSNLWFLAVISYAIFANKLFATKRPYLTSAAFGSISSFATLYWVSSFVGILPLLALTFLQTLFFIPLGFLSQITSNKYWLIPSILLLEEIRTRFPFGGFGWTRLAFSQSASPWVSLASIAGVGLVSAVTLFTSITLISRQKYLALLPLLAIFLSNPIPNSSMSVVGVQGLTPERGLDFNLRARAVFSQHLALSETVPSNKYDLIVWPENAVDVDPFQNLDVGKNISDQAKRKSTPIIVGAVVERSSALFNSSILYKDNGETDTIYDKRHLTPFGEYIPLRSIVEKITPLANRVRNFSSGDSAVIHKIEGNKLAPIICYEIIDDHLVREAARKSAAFIVQTNNATFAGEQQSKQQMAITRIRAIEHSRAIFSISTVGKSIVMDTNGKGISEIPSDVATLLIGKLPLTTETTLATKLGDYGILITLFAVLLTVRLGRQRW